MTNSEQGLTLKLQPAESVRRRWEQEWHRDGRDTIGYESAHNDVLDLCDAIDALTAELAALIAINEAQRAKLAAAIQASRAERAERKAAQQQPTRGK